MLAIHCTVINMEETRRFCHKCAFKILSHFHFCPKCGTKLFEEEGSNVATGLRASTSTFRPSSTSRMAQVQLGLGGEAGEPRTSQTSRKRSSSASHLPGKPSKSSIQSFQEFKSFKEAERRSSFSIRNVSHKKKKEEKPVIIHVGLMTDALTIKRGQNLPIRVLPSATAAEILSLAVKKHSAFNSNFNSKARYKLAYKDGTEVVNVPGTTNPFTLEKYKEASDYSYARIVLYLLHAPRLKCSDVWNELIKDNETSTDDYQTSDSELDHPSVEIQPISPLSSSLLPAPLPGSSDGSPMPAINLVECPTCFQKFPAADVSSHADDCAESYWSRTDSSFTDFGTSIKESKTMKEIYVPSLKSEIALLKETGLSRTPVIVTVRRKNIWNDFKQARDRYYKPDQALKLTFSGEPAIDIGGPKREFFAGIVKVFLLHSYFSSDIVH